MPTISHVFAVLALAALGAYAQGQANGAETPFALQSPSQLVQCKNTTIVWQGGEAPYRVALTPVCGNGKNSSEETHSVLDIGSTSIELPIRFAKDTPLIVSITDSNNMQAAAPQTIVASGDANDSCTTQIACTDDNQAPSVPIAAVDPTSQSTSTGFPTDRLVTADPSATPVQTPSMSDASSSGSTMVVLYSYVSQTSTPSASAESSLQSQPNAATPTERTPVYASVGFTLLVGASLAFGL